MLRLAVLILLLANAGYYAWSQGLLRTWGLAPATQSEPERLERQLNPDALKLLSAQSQPPAEADEPEPAEAAAAAPSAPPTSPRRAAPTPAASPPCSTPIRPSPPRRPSA